MTIEDCKALLGAAIRTAEGNAKRLAESGGDTSLARAFLFAALALGTVLQQIEEEELEEAEEA